MKKPRPPRKPQMPATGDKSNGNPFQHKRSREAEDCVVSWLEKGYTVGYAADKANISRQTLLEWRKDQNFNARVEQAIERGTDVIEDEARRRAVDGVSKPVYQGGECVGHVQEYSDALMQMILGGRRNKYRKQQVEHSGPNGQPIPHKIEVEFV